MKRKLLPLSLLLLFCLSVVLPHGVLADSGPSIILTLSKSSVTAGEEIQVTAVGDGLVDLYSFEINFEFDSGLLEFSSLTPPAGGFFSIDPIVEGNRIQFAHVIKSGQVPGINGRFTFCTLSLKTKGSGNASVKLSSAKLVHSDWTYNVHTNPSQVTAAITSKQTVTDPPRRSGGGGILGAAAPGDTGNDMGAGNLIVLNAAAVLDAATGSATVSLDPGTWSQAVQQARSGHLGIRVEIPEVPGAASYTQLIPAAVISDGAAQLLAIEVASPVATVTLSSNMFRPGELQKEAVGLRIARADMSHMNEGTRGQIGMHPVYDLSLMDGEKEVVWSNPQSPVKVSIPYTPTAMELANPEHIVVRYIDSQGKGNVVPNGKYHPDSGKITFRAAHLGSFAIGFIQKSFKDIVSMDWAQHPIEVLASKEIIHGVDDNLFNPNEKVSRADFVLLLVRTLELNGVSGSGFSDVPSGVYYDEALRMARGVGIIEGTGSNLFHPASPITREEMMAMTERALKAANQGVPQASTDILAEFGDISSIAPYALQSAASLVAAGLVHGFDDGIHPKEFTSRAQAAVLMYNIYNRM